MASLTITAANIVPQADATGQITFQYKAGATLTAGQAVYLDTSNTWQLSDANGAAALQALNGMTVCGGAANQFVGVLTGGSCAFGAILTAGTYYILGATAPGDFAPDSDRTTGWRVIYAFYATSTTVGRFAIHDTGVTL